MSSIYLRGGIWQYQRVRPGAKPIRRSLATRSRSEAKQKQRTIDAMIDRGEQTEEVQSEACLSAWVEGYKRWAVKHVKNGTVVEKMRYLDEWIALTGKDDVTTITPDDIERYKDTLRDKSKNMNVTINTKIIHLGSFVERCRRLKLHDVKNPFSLKEHEKLPVPKRHKPWISNPDQLRAVIEVSRKLDYDLYVFVMIGVFAGLRRAEIDASQWTWINWDVNPPLFQVINAAKDEDGFTLKDRTDRSIPICDDLRAVLEHGRGKSGHIVAPEYEQPNDEGIRRDFASKLLTVGKYAELSIRLTPHVLRHTFASRLASAGVSLLEIAKYLGHEDPKLTYSCYAHLSPSSESINKLNLGV